MNNDLHDQIYRNMELKETDELLEIWKENDHVEWSDQAFGIIKEVLLSRNVELPEQDSPINEYEEDEGGELVLSEAEREILEDQNPPDFYDPLEIIRMEKRLRWGTKAVIGIVIIDNVLRFRNFTAIASMYMRGQEPLVVNLTGIILLLINAGILCLLYYLLFTSLARILKILMQMEFNSRKSIHRNQDS